VVDEVGQVRPLRITKKGETDAELVAWPLMFAARAKLLA